MSTLAEWTIGLVTGAAIGVVMGIAVLGGI